MLAECVLIWSVMMNTQHVRQVWMGGLSSLARNVVEHGHWGDQVRPLSRVLTLSLPTERHACLGTMCIA